MSSGGSDCGQQVSACTGAGQEKNVNNPVIAYATNTPVPGMAERRRRSELCKQNLVLTTRSLKIRTILIKASITIFFTVTDPMNFQNTAPDKISPAHFAIIYT